jgi:hypothetical protein
VALVRGRKTHGAVWRFCFFGISDILQNSIDRNRGEGRLRGRGKVLDVGDKERRGRELWWKSRKGV